MKHRKWFRWTCIVLAVALLAGIGLTAFASSLAGDLDGDGRITAFDAQILAEYRVGNRQLEDESAAPAELTVASILETIWGGKPACTDSDGDGVYEIYSAQGLFYMANHPKKNYILMNDIDLSGYDWVPVVGFGGSFEGNGKTISNVNITRSTVSYLAVFGAEINMGFWGDTTSNSVISNLHLRNVTVTATEESQYLGLLAGSIRGQVTGCTVTGTLIDNRESHGTESGEITFIGALVGRICIPGTNSEVGSVVGGTSLSVLDEQGKYETSGLCADVKLLIADEEHVNLKSGIHQKIGLVGWAPTGATVSGIWSDSSNSSDLLCSALQQRQDIAVDYMNMMGTVAWTPSETLVYQESDGSTKTFRKDITYYGLPYNHHTGSYERFLSAMQTQNEAGTYVTKTNLGDSIYSSELGGYEGFVQLMGNDCASSLNWAWMQISPSRVKVDTESYAGGMYFYRTRYLVPKDSTRVDRGIYPIGDWVTSNYNEATGTWTAVEYDPSLAAYPITTEWRTEDILAAVGEDGMLEVYAQIHKADGLVRHRADSDNGPHYGHCRMAVTDPVVIRNADGTIDGEKSYLLTTEQGGGTTNAPNSTWTVNYQRFFAEMMAYDPETAPDNNGPYLPVRIRALQDEAVKAPYVTAYPTDPLSGPVSGKFYSNYRFNSITVTVTYTDQENNTVTVYDNEVFTGVSASSEATRNSEFTTVKLETLHGSAFYAAAEQAGLTDGQICQYSVTALLSDGTQINLNEKFLKEEISSFTYTAPATAETSESAE